ncbi:site-specific DNA-methyltransferase [Acidovorax sp.]|uniref:site-specific DNA-methyltransferase n=1 Tax=Acidovorax sp. TaxID=1872122 RepID=UPI0025BB9623|nr:site-specific DNA-methyltransferase [Acidovorax sp.]
MPTLDWLHRAAAFSVATQVPYRLLETVSHHGSSSPDKSTDNLLIHGDNLEALKALMPFYRGRIKCIFIDPPYNTQSAFEHYDDKLEHSQWLSMMLPRLELLRDLLSEDGSIWVTIDDNEAHYLKVLMDEVFGRGNFVNTVVWEKTTSARNDVQLFSSDQDYVHVYAKCLSTFKLNRLERTESSNNAYKNPDDDPRGPWREIDYKCAKTADERPNLFYPIRHPVTGAEVWPRRSRVWAYGQQEHARHVEEGLLWWGKTGNYTLPKLKKFFSDAPAGLVPRTLWFASEVDQTRTAKKEMKELFPEAPFATPKPERLLQRVLRLATNPGDLVLDSFLGSGTTAAVAHKMGRRWIGIEMGEHALTHCLPRLQKVVAGEQGGISAAVGWGQSKDGQPFDGGGFRLARLGAPVFGADGSIDPGVRFATLAAYIWQQETATAWDAAQGTPGTPYLGTHSVFDSCSRLMDGRQGPILLETSGGDAPPPVHPEPVEGLQGSSALASRGSARTEGDEEAESASTTTAPPPPVLRSRTAYYLLFNGILGDKRPAGGNVLTHAVLQSLLHLHAATSHPDAPLVVYGEACRLGAERLAQANVVFKHIPYDVKAR